MKNTEKGFVAFSILAILVLLSGGVFFYAKAQSKKELAKQAQVQDIKNKIVDAEAQVRTETSKLNYLSGIFRDQNPVYAVVHDYYQRVSDAIESTDAVFQNPATSKPEIKVSTKTETIKQNINDKRAKMNLLLAQWKKMANAAFVQETSKNTIQNIQKDAQAILSFIQSVHTIVVALTPENSGLTQAEIDAYVNSLAQASAEIISTINSLNVAISVLPIAPTQTSSSTPPISVVTPATVSEQQVVVQQAVAQVVALQAQLAQVQTPAVQTTQTQSTSQTPAPTSTSSQTTTIINVPQVSAPALPSAETDTSLFPDVSVQPGPEQLIQGANSF